MDSTPNTLSPRPTPAGLRASDLERNTACDLLSAHFAAGRLSEADLEHRLAWAMQAQTREDLNHLLADLPAVLPAAPRAPEPPPHRAAGWTGRELVVLGVLVCCVMITGVMLVGIGFYSPALFMASVVGGTLAAIGGGCLVHLVRAPRQ